MIVVRIHLILSNVTRHGGSISRGIVETVNTARIQLAAHKVLPRI